jgi:hypothetical protein
MSHRPRERAFRLGEIASGEPHLYCGHAPPPLMPSGLAVLLALCRRIHLAAQRWLSRRRREQIVIADAGAAELVPSPRARAGRVS